MLQIDYFVLPHLFYIKNGYNHSNHIRHCMNLYKLHLQDFYTIFMTVNCSKKIIFINKTLQLA